MWTIDRIELDRGTQSWRGVAKADRGLSFDEVCKAWRTDEAFRDFWVASLENPFDAYCWECPPVSDQSRSRPFECVFVVEPLTGAHAAGPGDIRRTFSSGLPNGHVRTTWAVG